MKKNKEKVIITNTRTGEVMEEFELRKTIEQISASIKNSYSAQKLLKKPFYHYYEWSGWRFYLKAIRYGDWKSIISHLKNK